MWQPVDACAGAQVRLDGAVRATARGSCMQRLTAIAGPSISLEQPSQGQLSEWCSRPLPTGAAALGHQPGGATARATSARNASSDASGCSSVAASSEAITIAIWGAAGRVISSSIYSADGARVKRRRVRWRQPRCSRQRTSVMYTTRPTSVARASLQLLLPALLIVCAGVLIAIEGHGGPVSRQLGLPAAVTVNLLYSALWLAIAWLLARALRGFVWEGTFLRRTGQPAPRMVRDLVHLMIILVTLTGLATFVWSRSPLGFLATTGAVGVMLGFGAQGMLRDVFSGLTIHIEHAYNIGDWIQLLDRDFRESVSGKVININWRSTHLLTWAGNVVVVPHSRANHMAVNVLSHPNRASRFDLRLVLGYELPPDRMMRVLQSAALEVCDGRGPLAEPPVEVLVDGIEERGVCYLIRYWVDVHQIAPDPARSRLMLALIRALQLSGVSAPYPRLEIGREPRWDLGTAGLTPERVLGKVPLFAGLDPGERQQIAAAMTERKLFAGERVWRPGDTGDWMGLVGEGVLDVLAFDKRGREHRAYRVSWRDVFGELELLSGAKRTTEVRAATDALIYVIDRAAITTLISARPELAILLGDAAAIHNKQQLAALAMFDDETIAPAGMLDRMRQFLGGLS